MRKCGKTTRAGTKCKNSQNCRVHRSTRKSARKSPRKSISNEHHIIKIISGEYLDMSAQRVIRDRISSIIGVEPRLRLDGSHKIISLQLTCSKTMCSTIKEKIRQSFPGYKVI